MSAATVKQTLI